MPPETVLHSLHIAVRTVSTVHEHCKYRIAVRSAGRCGRAKSVHFVLGYVMCITSDWHCCQTWASVRAMDREFLYNKTKQMHQLPKFTPA